MKKTHILLGFAVISLVGIFFLGRFAYRNLRGIGPAISKPPANIVDLIEGASTTTVSGSPTDFPLNMPEGFSISVFAKDLSGARVLAQDSRGNIWVSRTSDGAVTMLDVEDGKVVKQEDIFTELNNPHGLAFDPQNPDVLYISEEDRISHVMVYRSDATAPASDIEQVKLSLRLYSSIVPAPIADLPSGGKSLRHHFTRTIHFGPDGRLYVSLGSSCNVCHEAEDKEYLAKVISMKKDGSDIQVFAKGLRNTVFFAWHPVTKELWGVDMGRDGLGDDLPPDEVNIL